MVFDRDVSQCNYQATITAATPVLPGQLSPRDIRAVPLLGDAATVRVVFATLVAGNVTPVDETFGLLVTC